MRIVTAGDHFWACHQFAAMTLRGTQARYGSGIVIVHRSVLSAGGKDLPRQTIDAACDRT